MGYNLTNIVIALLWLLVRRSDGMTPSENMLELATFAEDFTPKTLLERSMNVQLWTTSDYDWGSRMELLDFWKAVVARFGSPGFNFQPRMYIPNSSPGRVVLESARQLCLWDIYGSTDVSGILKYFYYIENRRSLECYNVSTDDCLEKVYQAIGVDSQFMDQCLFNSAKFVVGEEIKDSIAMNISSKEIPALFINGRETPQTDTNDILRKICHAFPKEGKPAICNFCTEYCPKSTRRFYTNNCLWELTCGGDHRHSFESYLSAMERSMLSITNAQQSAATRDLQLSGAAAPTAKATTLIYKGAPAKYYSRGDDPTTPSPAKPGMHVDRTVSGAVIGYHNGRGYHANPGQHIPEELNKDKIQTRKINISLLTIIPGLFLGCLVAMLVVYRRAEVSRATRQMHINHRNYNGDCTDGFRDEEDPGVETDDEVRNVDLDTLPDFGDYIDEKTFRMKVV